MKKKFSLACVVAMMPMTVSAEVTEYRLGDLITSILEVLGFTVLDITAAIYDLVYLSLALALAYAIYRLVVK